MLDHLASIGTRAENHRPFARFDLDRDAWACLITTLAEKQDWSLLGLWADTGIVHMALRDEAARDEAAGTIGVVSLACPEGRFPSVGGVRPAAIRLERAAQDLFGITALSLVDPRPWLDHDSWPIRLPLSADPPDPLGQPEPYPFLPVEGPGLHQIPVGPVHAGIIEPGHFRFTCNGETVVRLEQRLGYVHKGTEWLMAGRSIAEAAKLAARVSGDSTVAHSWAFAGAIEAATGTRIPPRAILLRALMAELERLANHLGDIGAICNDAAFAFMLAECGLLREKTLRTADACFGHRLMMDRIVPGGVAVDLAEDGRLSLGRLIEEVGGAFPRLVRIYEEKASLQDRTAGTGRVDGGLVHRFGAGGHVGRASGRSQDARRSPGYAPYDELDFSIPVFTEGDVNARVWVRIREVEASLSLIQQIMDRLPVGPIHAPVVPAAGQGMALVESFRGEIMTWVAVREDGIVTRCHPRDPSWFQWPLLEAAIEGNIVADFPLCNKSFNCSYSGHDL
jgi:Ni,Fe-hydrogenase III large subunit